MKHLKLTFLVAMLMSMASIYSIAVTVTIDGIQYSLRDTEAIVIGFTSDMSEDVVIPETIQDLGLTYTVTTIGYGAFKGNTRIKTLKASDSLKKISDGSYYGDYYDFITNPESAFCNSTIEEIQLPGIEEIGTGAFFGCKKLKRIVFGNNYRQITIGQFAFWDCSELRYIVAPNIIVDSSTINPFMASNIQLIIIWGAEPTGNYGSSARIIGKSSVQKFIEWQKDSFTYTGLSPEPSYLVSDEIPAGFQPTKVIMSETNKEVGTYTVDVPVTFTNSDMSLEVNIPYTYTITPVSLTATIQNATREYGEENPNFNVTFTGFVNNETEDVLSSKGMVTTSATPMSDVGTYPVTLSDANARNYTITSEPATLTVTKAPLTAKVTNMTKIYGQNNPQFTFNFTGLKNGETSPQWITTPIFITEADSTSSVGLYPITVSGGEAKNYELDITDGTGILTINQADLTITTEDISRPYFEENPTLTCKYTGFVNGENASVLTTQPTLSTNATLTSETGNYPITVSGAEAQNYSIAYKSGNLEVTKRQLTVFTDNYIREYKEENPKFVLRYSGFVNNETEDVLISKPTASTQATVDSEPGIYPIIINGGVAVNYEFLYNKSNLTIEKAYQTLNWTQEFDELEVYSQTELTAKSTSGLDITYTILEGDGASITKTGKKIFLECTKAGTIVVCAQQTGNNNYYESNKVYKTIRVGKQNPADVNGDGAVDSADIVAVIKEMPNGDKKADVNGDGAIDSADIVAVIKAMK